jgi:hypothetical protein
MDMSGDCRVVQVRIIRAIPQGHFDGRRIVEIVNLLSALVLREGGEYRRKSASDAFF